MSVIVGAWRRGSAVRAALVTAALAAGTLTAAAPAAHADPSASDWAKLRMCESSGNYAINTGNGYYGAYQFNIGTWEWVGGVGLPSDASPAEQDYRALKLYRINGWAPWPACTKKLGLTNDKDAKSKVIPPEPDFGPATQAQEEAAAEKAAEEKAAAEKKAAEKKAAEKKAAEKKAAEKKAAAAKKAAEEKAAEEAAQQEAADKAAAKKKKKAAAAKKKREAAAQQAPVVAAEAEPVEDAEPAVEAELAPEWPGRPFLPGEYSEDLKTWQQQAATLGYDVVPTGYFGPKTERVARKIQDQHGISQRGTIGPQTWSAAWTAP